MKFVMEHEKRKGTTIAAWSPALQLYVLCRLECRSFYQYCSFWEITKDDYEHFEEKSDVNRGRFLWSNAPDENRTPESRALWERFG